MISKATGSYQSVKVRAGQKEQVGEGWWSPDATGEAGWEGDRGQCQIQTGRRREGRVRGDTRDIKEAKLSALETWGEGE